MSNKLIPDALFDDIYQLTPEFFAKNGVSGVVFDIDNTISPYEKSVPDEKAKTYFALLKENGIKAAFLSNNEKQRVELFNEDLGLFYVCKAKKPSKNGVLECISHFGLQKEQVAAVGDQLFTDCLAAHRAGIKFFMVLPIQPRENLFFRFKRLLEKPFMTAYRRKHRNVR